MAPLQGSPLIGGYAGAKATQRFLASCAHLLTGTGVTSLDQPVGVPW